MRVNIKATNIELTNEIREYIEKRISSLEKFFNTSDPIIQFEVSRTTNHHKHGDIFKAEINMMHGGKNFRTEATHADLFSAIDEVRDDSYNKLVSFKDRMKTLFVRGARSVKKRIKGFKPW
jgi:putative sigma-54 modulation protein